MSSSKIVLLLVLTFSCGMCFAEVYQWTDEHGTTHFSDKPINSKAKKLDISPSPKHDVETPLTANEAKKNNAEKSEAKKARVDSKAPQKETAKETEKDKARKSREQLTEELIKAREIREAERKKQKEAEQLELLKCQDEKTKLALMKNEIEEYDKRLKTISRSERQKSDEYIKKTDLEIRLQHQKEITYELCN